MDNANVMNALWLEDGRLSVQQVPVPQPAENEALIGLRLAGICGTDLELVEGYYPFAGVLGHEFVGDVLACPGKPELVGQRVVGEINLSCGRCEQCLNLRPTHCSRRTVLGIVNRHGVFGERFALPVKNLHPVPEGVDDETAVLTEPLAAACQCLEQLPVKPRDRVLVVGAGRLGQLIAQVLSLTGCRLSVVAKYSRQRSLLNERGIRTVEPENVPHREWDVVVEATGDTSGFELATRAIRPLGTIALKSTYRGAIPIDFSALVVDEISLVGSRCGPFAPALRLMAQSLVEPRVIVDCAYPLKSGIKAFEQARSPGALKVLLHP